MSQSPWKDEANVELARKLYVDRGLSASVTAAELPFECNRNQIISLANRRGWRRSDSLRAANISLAASLQSSQARAARAAAPRRAAPVAPAPQSSPAPARGRPAGKRVATACLGCPHFGEKARGVGLHGGRPSVAANERPVNPLKMECLWFWTREGKDATSDERLSMMVVSASGGAGCQRRPL